MKQGINCAMHSYLNNLMYTHTYVYIRKKNICTHTYFEWKLSINRDRPTQEKPSEHIPSVNQATKKPHMEGVFSLRAPASGLPWGRLASPSPPPSTETPVPT